MEKLSYIRNGMNIMAENSDEDKKLGLSNDKLRAAYATGSKRTFKKALKNEGLAVHKVSKNKYANAAYNRLTNEQSSTEHPRVGMDSKMQRRVAKINYNNLVKSAYEDILGIEKTATFAPESKWSKKQRRTHTDWNKRGILWDGPISAADSEFERNEKRKNDLRKSRSKTKLGRMMNVCSNIFDPDESKRGVIY